ncbi:MAG: selenium cofactor biosynthesis protein YqeC, partial [Sedimentibacter sp.]
ILHEGNMKTLIELFDIKKGNIISVVGTGGKTTLLYELGKKLKNQYNVLLTTSTKIIKPSNENYDYIYTSMEDYINDSTNRKKGLTVLSKGINSVNQKMLGIDDEFLEKIINDYDIVLIEADGSRNLPLKGWKKHEPPILSKTNKIVGVFPVDMLGKRINKDKIYGFEEFQTFINNEDFVCNDVVGRICSNENGIFKNSRGELYFFINHANNDEGLNKAFELAKYLKNFIVGNPFDFKICIGSLKKGEFYEY